MINKDKCCDIDLHCIRKEDMDEDSLVEFINQFRNNKRLLGYPKAYSEKLKNHIKERDDYICQKCGESKYTDLEVHHIDYNKFDNFENNLISLCSDCNKEVNGNRYHWYCFFNNKLGNS